MRGIVAAPLFGLVAIVASGQLHADALWDAVVAKALQAERLVAAETRIESRVLKEDGSLIRGRSELVRARLVDGAVLREETNMAPAEAGNQASPGGKKRRSGSPTRGLLEGEGGGLSPFAHEKNLSARPTGKEEVVVGERARVYEVSWTGEEGYAFEGLVWVSAERAAVLRAEYALKKGPWGSEVRKLEAWVEFGEFQGLPVKTSLRIEAKAVYMIVFGVELRATTSFSDYFDPRKEAR